jgi:uncharacterized membrane protein
MVKHIVGGLAALLPFLLIALLAERLFVGVRAAVHPMLDAMPGTVFHAPGLRLLVVVAVFLCVLAAIGWFAERPAGRAFGRGLERLVLSRLPFYTLLRRIASGLAGAEDEQSMKPVEVEVNPGIRQWGFLTERHADGRCTVFLPASPPTGGGTVLCVDGALVRDVPLPGHRLVQCLGQWGNGSSALLAAVKSPSGKIT